MSPRRSSTTPTTGTAPSRPTSALPRPTWTARLPCSCSNTSRRPPCCSPTSGTITPIATSGICAIPVSTRPGSPPAAPIRRNLARVHLYPEVFFFPAGGASVHHLAAPGTMTLARLTREDGDYRMQLMLGEFETYDEQTNESLMKQSTREWPHAFARLDARAEDFLSRFGANHIHGVPGDHRAAVRATCELLGVTLDEFTRDPR
ncbi:hypothetical protein [Nocardia amikacinitolerans]|uniref:hypothetical protein n=1 Tax=Nocardia amikacinitolerans TaxID=756689 RepID=UPI003558C47E